MSEKKSPDRTTVPTVKPAAIASCVKAIAAGCVSIETIAGQLTGKAWSKVVPNDKRNATMACNAAEYLGLISQPTTGHYIIPNPNVANAARDSEAAFRIVFREAIQQQQCFLTYWALVSKGIADADAVTQTANVHRLKLDGAASGVLKEWGAYAGVLIDSPGGLTAKVVHAGPSPVSGLQDWVAWDAKLQDQLEAQAWVRNVLTPTVLNDLPAAVVNDLASAVTDVSAKPKEALRKVGIAVEDTLKEVARRRGISLVLGNKKIDQIMGLVQLLRRHGALADKHVNSVTGLEVLCERTAWEGLGAFRNMPSHGVSVEDWQRWEVSSELTWTVLTLA
ncbi:MAG: hypothetical protein ABFD96_21090, partial [Armatimonadia bacterium]